MLPSPRTVIGPAVANGLKRMAGEDAMRPPGRPGEDASRPKRSRSD